MPCRGVALEGLNRFEEAISDYKAVLAVAPDDPAGWNNLGNASNGLGRWATLLLSRPATAQIDEVTLRRLSRLSGLVQAHQHQDHGMHACAPCLHVVHA